MRVLLGMALVGLMLAGIWQGEIHAHGGGDAAHSHAAGHYGDPPGSDSRADGAAAGSLHVHDAASVVAASGAAVHLGALHYSTSAPMPDRTGMPPPYSAYTAPHRPPIV